MRALQRFEKVDVAFDGYDRDPRHLWEIPEVRAHVAALDGEFPFWLFVLTKYGLGLQCIMFCLMPPFLSDAARKTIWPERLGDLLTRRWFPAMNQVCEMVTFGDKQVEALTERVESYFVKGPTPSNFKPDYGLALVNAGVSRLVDLYVYAFKVFGIDVLGPNAYSTIVDGFYEETLHALSLDFNREQLEIILSKAAPDVAADVRRQLASSSPAKKIDLSRPITMGIRARLGELQFAANEQFVPLIVQDIL
jgi:hypothetical protein